MRLTNKLFAQHLGWMFKKHWHYKRNRRIIDTGALAVLEGKVVVKNPKGILEQQEDKLSPSMNTSTSVVSEHLVHLYNDTSVLLGGLQQAQAITKSIEIKELPRHIHDAINKFKIPPIVDKNVQKAIKASHVFDTEQEKLEIIKVPERPAFVLPRQYGITRNRRCKLLMSKLLFETEKLASNSLTSKRMIIHDALFSILIGKGEDKIQMNLTSDQLLSSDMPLENINGNFDGTIPNLHPMKHTVSIPQSKFISDDLLKFPLTERYSNLHTLCLYFSPLETKNVFDSPVTDTQIQGRSLVKSFTAAAAKAKTLYGHDVKELPKPIVVQCIQTDGKLFHFGVFQLNSLDLDGFNGTKNVWFHIDNINLFNVCEYQIGKPILDGYNKNVIRILNAFYNSI